MNKYLPGYSLFNSEEINWIFDDKSQNTNLGYKPDLFIAPPLSVLPMKWPSVKDKSQSEETKISDFDIAMNLRDEIIRNDESKRKCFQYSKCHYVLCDSVICLLEAKTTITLHASLGEIHRKLARLYKNYSHVKIYHCILFSLNELYLLEFNATTLTRSMHISWTTPKSLFLFINFISPFKDIVDSRPLWLKCTMKSCGDLEVEVIEHKFLGSGATGKKG